MALAKKECALEAKKSERRQKLVGTCITATKETLLQVQQLRDRLASDHWFLERHARKIRWPVIQSFPWSIQQTILKMMVDGALAGTPEGDIPDDWESSLEILPDDCIEEAFKEAEDLLGPEDLEKGRAALLRIIEAEGEDEDEDDEEEMFEAEEQT